MTSEKPKVRNIRIRVVDNGFILETSPFTDGSGSNIKVFRKTETLVNAVLKAIGFKP